MTDEPATDPLAPLEAKARALRAQKDAAHRNTVLHEAAAAISADAALRETEGECSLAEYGRELARLVEGLADAAAGPGRADGEPQQDGKQAAGGAR